MKNQNEHYILTVRCPDTVGISAAISGFLATHGAFITESSHFGDPDTNRFFMRTVFRGGGPHASSIDDVKGLFKEVADRFDMEWAIHRGSWRPKVLIAVSKFGHCLNDLLYRWKKGALAIDIVGVISNHEDMRELVEWHDIPYHYLPVTKATKAKQETQFLKLVDELNVDLVVLARYMQILSDYMAGELKGRCINIHHSFLPSFKGAKPYHQAHDRGVKIIGATAHYVTADLDEGPIIEQEIARVDHTYTPNELVATGCDVENVALARAVRWHVERRVFLNGKKTVVLK